MINNNLSTLTAIKINNDTNIKFSLEIYDPKTGSLQTVPPQDLPSINEVNNLINTIKSKVENNDNNQFNYAHWIKRGWRKSLDYYMASRTDSTLTIVTNLVSNTQSHYAPLVKDNSKQLYSTQQALVRRKTRRGFKNIPVNMDIFFTGIKNLFPSIEINLQGFHIYIIAYNIDQVSPGTYSYDTKNHSLSLIHKGNFSIEMSNNLQGMKAPRTAVFTIILVADFNRLQKLMPYPRGLRDTFIETGRLAQKIIISYMRFGIYALVTPALSDKTVIQLLKLKEPDYYPLYSLTFGYPLKM